MPLWPSVRTIPRGHWHDALSITPSIHLAVGRGFPEIGGKNESAVHWDMICDMRNGGQIHVDGELFYDSGRFPLLGQ